MKTIDFQVNIFKGPELLKEFQNQQNQLASSSLITPKGNEKEIDAKTKKVHKSNESSKGKDINKNNQQKKQNNRGHIDIRI
jgi:Skp family chaperone for outer membrane proteins